MFNSIWLILIVTTQNDNNKGKRFSIELNDSYAMRSVSKSKQYAMMYAVNIIPYGIALTTMSSSN